MSVYKLVVRDGDQKEQRKGTAWQLGANLVVTAFHVVGNQIVGKWLHEALAGATYHLIGADGVQDEPLDPVGHDPKADIAILRSRKALPSPSLLVSSFGGAVWADWRAEGFPEFIGRHYALHGMIAASGSAGSDHDLQLTVAQGTAVRWSGASGSAVCSGDHVVGILTSEVAEADTLWAAGVEPLWGLLRKHGLEGEVRDRQTDGALPAWFVPRDYVVERFKLFMEQNRSGYFPVVAEAGVGKTGLARDVARRFGAVAYFFNQTEGRTRAEDCLREFGRQLSRRHGLPFDSGSSDPGLALGELLKRIPRADHRVVLVLDAVDESDHPGDSTNPALLPGELPENIFVFLTHRPPIRRIRTEPGTETRVNEPLQIQTSDDHQREVIETYVRRRVQEDDRIARRGQAADLFVDKLLKNSEANFRYVAFVLDDVARPTESGGETDWLVRLDKLPPGLRDYYQHFWDHFESRREGWEEWTKLYRPTLLFLVASREPVSVEWLAEFVGRDSEEIESRVLRDWRRFLHVGRGGDKRDYWGVVHQSFCDYVTAEHPKLNLPVIHGRIAGHYLTAWGGLEQWLPRLGAPQPDWDGGYGLRHVAHHMRRSQRYVHPSALPDQPFFAAQVQRLGSYKAALEDLKRAACEADKVGDRVRMLGLALAHGRLMFYLLQLGALDVIPLIARFDEEHGVERALNLIGVISDPAQRARTQVTVAREVFPSDPGRARCLVREALESSPHDREELFRLVADWLPEELVSFLVRVKTHEPFLALLRRYWSLHETPTCLMLRRLPEEEVARLRAALRSLPQSPEADWTWPLRLLQILLESDTTQASEILAIAPKAGTWSAALGCHLASWEGAGLIIQARLDRAAPPDHTLTLETVQRTRERLLAPDTKDGELEFLLGEVVLPNLPQFRECLQHYDPSEDRSYVGLFRKLLPYLPKNVDGKAMIEAALSLRRTLAERIKSDPVRRSITSYPRLGRLAELLARTDLPLALEFLRKAKGIAGVGSGEVDWPSILGAAAMVAPEDALKQANLLAEKERQLARSEIAASVAGDLTKALTLWRSLDRLDGPDKTKALLHLLENVSSQADYAQALQIMEEELKLESWDPLYKGSFLAEAAVRLRAVDQAKARSLLLSVLSDLVRPMVEQGRESMDLLRLIPLYATCGLLGEAEGLRSGLSSDDGLSSLVDPLIGRQLREDGRLDLLPEYGDREMSPQAELGDLWVSGRFLTKLAHDPATLRASRLLSLRLWHVMDSHGKWRLDHVKALWAANVAAYNLDAACRVADSIGDAELYELTLLTLAEYGLSRDMLERRSSWCAPLCPLACVRLAATAVDAGTRATWLDRAYRAATVLPSFRLQADDLDFLLEFVREATELDSARAREWTSCLVQALSTADLGEQVLFVPRLRNRFPVFAQSERDAVQTMYENWAKSLMEWARQPTLGGERVPEQSVPELAAMTLVYIACGLLPLDKRRGFELLTSAVRYATMVGNPALRSRCQCEILQALLALPNGLGWSEAVLRSFDFGDAILHDFDYFGRALLELEPQNVKLASRAVEMIQWAERFTGSRSGVMEWLA